MKPWFHLLRKGILKFAHIEPIVDEWFTLANVWAGVYTIREQKKTRSQKNASLARESLLFATCFIAVYR